MARELNGLELQGFIKQRQLRQVRNLRQQFGITPKLLIIKSTSASEVINTYIRMKQRYARDIFIDVEVVAVDETEMPTYIQRANADSNIQGIIVQLPLKDPSQTNIICNMIDPKKDVDGLGANAGFPSATAQAIDWLLTGYSVELTGKQIAIVGTGKLVGAPLAAMWKARGLSVTTLDESSVNVQETLRGSDIIVTATGVPRLITAESVKQKAVVVDAGTASEGGFIVGDVDDSVRERKDVSITPVKGGVGPLTYTVLFDHLIEACLRNAGQLN
jgi:methylenetetrahydrofolate dehydrogenase (NADP+)/methenyltetrahydrofolate cyclohydrolase